MEYRSAKLLITHIAKAGLFAACILTAPASAQWMQSTGPYGGTINALLCDSGSLYAGTDNGAVFRSANNGTLWQFSSEGFGAGVSSIQALLRTPDFLFSAGAGGIFRSDDSGAMWSAVDSGLADDLWITALGAKDSFVYAGTSGNRLYRSADKGSSWTRCDSGLGAGAGVRSIVAHRNCLFASVHSAGVYRSDSNGTLWTQVNNGLANLQVWSLLSWNGYLFAATGIGVYRSDDSGSQWNRMDSSWSTSVYTLAARNGAILAGTLNGLRVSVDSGANFNWENAVGFRPVKSIAASGGKTWVGTYWDGVFYNSGTPTVWNEANTGLTGIGVLALATGPGAVFAGLDYGLSRSTDQGATWVRANLPNGLAIGCVAAGAGGVFAGCSYGLYRSVNNGDSWQNMSSGISGKNVHALSIGLGYAFAGTWDGYVFRSADTGKTWTRSDSGLPAQWVKSILVDSSTLWAGTAAGVFRSADTGKKWTAANGGTVPYNTYALIKRKNTLYAGTFSSGMFQAADSAVVEWKQVDTSSHDFIPAFAKKDTALYAATPHGMLASGDGITWATCGTGLENTGIRSLAVLGNGLLAGTAKRGIWFYPFPAVHASTVSGSAGHSTQFVRRIGKRIIIFNPGMDDASVAIVKVNGALVRSFVIKKGMTSIIDDFSKPRYAAGVYFISVKIRGTGVAAARVIVP
jgi:ligand-binding sensor domain-containing protein